MKKQILLASIVGNALEFFDFTLCGVFILKLSSVFFPSIDPRLAMLSGLFAFSAAFWTRPLGSLVFGYVGDKFGRKKALTFSILSMGLPTLFMGCLPGYESLGVWSPALLIGCRLIQGLSTGGEYNGAAIFALEHMGKKSPGLISGFISSSCVIGAILATLSAFLISKSSLEWAWRIPFLLGGSISLVGYYIRRNLSETQEFLNTQKETYIKNDAQFTKKKVLKSFFTSIVMGATNGALSYTLFGFLSLYLNKYVGLKLSESLFYNLFSLLSFMGSCIVFGYLSDHYRAKSAIYMSNGLAFVLAPLSFFLLQSSSLLLVVLGQISLGVVVGSFVGPSHHFLQTLMPTHIRYRGIGLGFCLGMALSGGTTQLLLVCLLDGFHNLYIPAIVIVGYSLMCTVALFLLGSKPSKEQKDTISLLEKAA